MTVWVFNALLVALDVAFAVRYRARPGLGRAAALLALYGVAAGLLACVFAFVGYDRHQYFALAQLCAFALFLHGPLLGAAVAAWAPKTCARTAVGGAAFSLGVALVAVHSFLVEPRWLEVTRTQVDAPGLRRPLRIALIADLQTDRPGDWERRVLQAAKETKPDLVLFTGDYVQLGTLATYQRARDQLNLILREVDLNPPLGAYAVRGDTEPRQFSLWAPLFAGTAITPLDQSGYVERAEWDQWGLVLGSLDVQDSRNPDLPLPPRISDAFHLVFGHAPDHALAGHAADLILAGHTHGGQVRLPWIGPLVTMTRVPRAIAGGGLHTLPHGGAIYVSRGLGMERGAAPRLRFGCRPELAVLELVPRPRGRVASVEVPARPGEEPGE